ncbi:alcohol dehydrogenase catalytic domain-containing protein, partial [Vibrio parahaemolyticus]
QGKYQLKAAPPFVPGAEVAGRIIETGAKVTQFKVGDNVAAFIPTGGYAKEVVASAHSVVPVPRGVEYSTAAAVTLVYGTSL